MTHRPSKRRGAKQEARSGARGQAANLPVQGAKSRHGIECRLDELFGPSQSYRIYRDGEPYGHCVLRRCEVPAYLVRLRSTATVANWVLEPDDGASPSTPVGGASRIEVGAPGHLSGLPGSTTSAVNDLGANAAPSESGKTLRERKRRRLHFAA